MIRTKRCPACQRENAITDLYCDCGHNFATGQPRYLTAEAAWAHLRSLVTLPVRGATAHLARTAAALRARRVGEASLHVLGIVGVVGALLFVSVGLCIRQPETPRRLRVQESMESGQERVNAGSPRMPAGESCRCPVGQPARGTEGPIAGGIGPERPAVGVTELARPAALGGGG